MRDEAIRISAQLGSLLRSERVSKKLTQAEVAAQLGISAQALSKLERDASRVSFERIHQLCRVLGLELLLRSSKPSNSPEGSW
jgi:HTH-type transcriptional regulator / antitoxin HipB